ncbi:hypothetical protein VTO73DRAFT_9168 [Trametes versicolor]
MDPQYCNKKIINLTEQELTSLGFLGPNALPGIKKLVEQIRADPERLGQVNCFQVELLRGEYDAKASAPGAPQASPTSPTFRGSPVLSDADTLFSQPNASSTATTVVALDLISQYESNFYYRGLSEDPPKLMWRSDLDTNPFPMPEAGEHFVKPPSKTAFGIFNTHLNKVWDSTVAPRIIALLKTHGIKRSVLKTARFLIVDEDAGTERWGPDTIWIAVHPNTTKAADARDVTPAILQILNDAQVYGAVVEWYEGAVKSLVGPPLMPIVDNSDPTFGLSNPFDVGLGIPIARASDNAQGTVTLLFHEVKTKDGTPSDRILALTNKHVATVDTTTDYIFDAANPVSILVCGERRFNRANKEIKEALNTGLRDAVRLAGELKDLQTKEGAPAKRAVQRKEADLTRQLEDNEVRQELFHVVNGPWKLAGNREFATVLWAPKISVSGRPYTRDIATLVVDEAKLEHFNGNIVNLGNQFTVSQLEDKFWPTVAIREDRTIPADLQLPIHAVLPRRLVMNPDTEDKNGEPLYIVAKYGNTTKLTLGNYSGMDAYVCTEFGAESRECVIYNGKGAGDFSAKGDSGSLIFRGDGVGVAMLHSGMPRGRHSHVTYAAPLWWVFKLVREEYPDAEFYGMTYTIED